MKATRLVLALALATGTTAALAAPAAAAAPSDPNSPAAYQRFAGTTIVVQNEAEKHRLEAQGFPQYTD